MGERLETSSRQHTSFQGARMIRQICKSTKFCTAFKVYKDSTKVWARDARSISITEASEKDRKE